MSQEIDVNELIAGADPQPPATPQPIPGTPPVAPAAQSGLDLSQYGITDPTQLPQIIDRANKYDDLNTQLTTLQGELGSYKVKAELDPFANPLAKKVNEMFSDGTPITDVAKFINLHTVDVDNITPEDAFRRKIKMDYPDISTDHLPHVINTELGVTLPPKPAAEAEAGEKAAYEVAVQQRKSAMVQKGFAAKKWFSEQRVGLKDPEKEKQKTANQQQQQQFAGSWAQISDGLVAKEMTIDYAIEDEKLGKYVHPGYKPKLSDEQKAKISRLTQSYAVKNSLPLTQDSVASVRQYQTYLTKVETMDDMIRSIMTDFHAEMTKNFLAKRAPVAANPGGAPTPVSKGKPVGQNFPIPTANDQYL